LNLIEGVKKWVYLGVSAPKSGGKQGGGRDLAQPR